MCTTEKNTLIVFIDSLPYSQANRMSFLSTARVLCELTPGLGYSINLLPELFGGYQPDDLGFFGEWNYAPAESPFAKIAWLLPLLSKLCVSPFTERAMRRLLRETTGPTFKIPLRHLDRFSRVEADVYSLDFSHQTLFSQMPDLFLILPYKGVRGQRDEDGYLQTQEQVQAHNKVYLALPDLDSYAHRYGMESQEYTRKIQQLDQWLQQLHSTLLKRYSHDSQMIVLSDHGMVDVTTGYYLQIEDMLVPSRKDTYTYFLDSTLMRIWVHDSSLYEPIRDYLDHLNVGTVLDRQDRSQYGIKSRAFGDFVFVLNEGVVFHPSSLSNSIPKAMHGYHPELASQKAVFAAWGATLPNDVYPRKTLQVAKTLNHIL
jgi:hypothetical protein